MIPITVIFAIDIQILRKIEEYKVIVIIINLECNQGCLIRGLIHCRCITEETYSKQGCLLFYMCFIFS